MEQNDSAKNPILGRISVAAKTILSHPRNLDIGNFIGFGPGIKARVRLAVISVLMVVAPIMLIGVLRTEAVNREGILLNKQNEYWRAVLQAKTAVQNLEIALLEYVGEKEFEKAQAVVISSDQVRLAILELVQTRPEEINLGPSEFLPGLVSRLDKLIKRSIASKSSMASVRLGVISVHRELNIIEEQISIISTKATANTLKSLAFVARDQLVLFLIILFFVPVFLIFIPSWAVRPLTRLRQMARKIEIGHLREIAISGGKDEVAVLARSLKALFLRKEDLDRKKSSKLFELRNVLRSVLKRVDEPIFIVDENHKINYTNEAAAKLTGIPPHQMEGTILSDCIFSPVVKKAVDLAFVGDMSEEALPVQIDVDDGRSVSMQSRIGVVRNRDGEVSRAVVILLFNSQNNAPG